MSEEKIISNKIEGEAGPAGGTIEQKPAEQGRVEQTAEAPERHPEQKRAEPLAPEAPLPALPVATMPPDSFSAQYKEREKKVEKILEQDLAGIYIALSPEKKQEFKAAGEATAKKINGLLSDAKVKIKSIVELIIVWLKIIPGLNRFFLEQEAKIKADEIMKLRSTK